MTTIDQLPLPLQIRVSVLIAYMSNGAE